MYEASSYLRMRPSASSVWGLELAGLNVRGSSFVSVAPCFTTSWAVLLYSLYYRLTAAAAGEVGQVWQDLKI